LKHFRKDLEHIHQDVEHVEMDVALCEAKWGYAGFGYGFFMNAKGNCLTPW